MTGKNNGLIFLIMILIGLVIGGLIGDILGEYVSILQYGKTIGVEQFTIDLSVMKITFGLTMSINLASIIGLFISIFLFKRL